MLYNRPWLDDIPFHNADYLELVHDYARKDPARAVDQFRIDSIASHRLARLSVDDVFLIAQQIRPLFTLIDHLAFKTTLVRLEGDSTSATLETGQALRGELQCRNLRYLELIRAVAKCDPAEAMVLFGIDYASASRIARLVYGKIQLLAAHERPLFTLIDPPAFKTMLVHVEAGGPRQQLTTLRTTVLLQDAHINVARAQVAA